MDRAEFEPPVSVEHEPLLAHDDVNRLAKVIHLAYQVTHRGKSPADEDIDQIMIKLRIPPTAA